MKILVGAYIAIIITFVLVLIIFFLYERLFTRNKIKNIKSFVDQLPEITLDEVRLQKRNNDFPGVYVLYNVNKSRYYVGQGMNVFSRVHSHFAGKGSPDVYVDVRNGDRFVIKIISFEASGYSSLDKLERHAIKAFNSYEEGYNKLLSDNSFGNVTNNSSVMINCNACFYPINYVSFNIKKHMNKLSISILLESILT